MTVKISPQKVSKILRYYFAGFLQVKIAKKMQVDQSTVSLYATKFKERVDEVGLLAAAEEHGVMEEVEGLRSLSVELFKEKLTTKDAKEGVKIIKTFMKLGISPAGHTSLVKICKEIKEPGLINAALKLVQVEAESNLSYDEAIARFEQVTSQIPVLDKQLEYGKAQLHSVNVKLTGKKQELADLVEYWKQRVNEFEEIKDKILQELKAKQKEMDVSKSEIDSIAKLKKDLTLKGMDIPTLIKLAEGVK